MVTTKKIAAGLVLGAALTGPFAAIPAQAAQPDRTSQAAPATDRHGRVEGTYRNHDACEDAGRRGQRYHRWKWFDCDRRDHGRGHDRRDGRHHDRDDWVLKVYR
ncbi:hypothetical protein [Cryptosporangium japonicum]|uniref:Uncharacterized protein n=1 Tax=Cryptosporangium japonicum TaxID=80872 RepID=A0ABP3DBF7_9ACTN